jgi:hypothetical protein
MRTKSMRQVSLRVAPRTPLSGTVPSSIDCILVCSNPHLLEAGEISRQINIDGEIGLMKVDGSAIQKVVDTKTETDHGVCHIDEFVIRRIRDSSLVNIDQDSELAVNTGVFQVRNCIGTNRFAVFIEDCDEIRLVFVQQGSVVNTERRCPSLQ